MISQLNFDTVNISTHSVRECAQRVIYKSHQLQCEQQIKQLLLGIKCIDLTTLSGDDTSVNVHRVCCRALKPLSAQTINGLYALQSQTGSDSSDGSGGDSYQHIRCAAVCVYPQRVSDCVNAFQKLGHSPHSAQSVNIASVGTGFPSAQYPINTRLDEIRYALECGATEIDVVCSRALVIDGQWDALYNELKQMRDLCEASNAHLKVILGCGELSSLENVYKASMTSMLAGAHFIKTSTGKETINATLLFGIVMTRAIWDFYNQTGIRVGFKPAGGLRTAHDAIQWLTLIKTQLGNEWLTPHLFRIGASSLLNDIDRHLFSLAHQRKPAHYELQL